VQNTSVGIVGPGDDGEARWRVLEGDALEPYLARLSPRDADAGAAPQAETTGVAGEAAGAVPPPTGGDAPAAPAPETGAGGDGMQTD